MLIPRMPSSSLIDSTLLICMQCKTPLQAAHQAYQCSECERLYDAGKAQDIPLPIAFFEEPKQVYADAYLGFYRAYKHFDQKAVQLTEGLKKSGRKKELLPVLKAFKDNQKYFTRFAEALAPSVDLPTLLEKAGKNAGQKYGYDFNYLERDWSQQPRAQLEISNLMSIVQKAVKHCSGEHAVVLGAGMGRLATELKAHHKQVTAIENSLGQIAQFYALLQQPNHFWRVNTINTRKDNDLLKKVNLQIPKALLADAKSVDYIWADACNSPLADRSVDVLYSIYFSDVVPLTKLLAESKRLLTEGGCFVHLGPLHYHFSDITQHYSLETFCAQLVQHGFVLQHQSEHEPVNIDDEGLQRSQQYFNALIVAKYDSAQDQHAEDKSSVTESS